MDNFVMETPPQSYFQQFPQYYRDPRLRGEYQGVLSFLDGDYSCVMYAVPGSNSKVMAARANFRTTLQVPPRSVLVGVRAAGLGRNPQFAVSIYEKGSQRYISPGPILGELLGGSASIATAKTNFTPRSSTSFLKTPFVVLDAGLLTVEITNVTTGEATIQMLLMFGVPKGGN